VKHDGVTIIFMLLEIHRGPVILLDCSSCAATFSCFGFYWTEECSGNCKISIQRTCEV